MSLARQGKGFEEHGRVMRFGQGPAHLDILHQHLAQPRAARGVLALGGPLVVVVVRRWRQVCGTRAPALCQSHACTPSRFQPKLSCGATQCRGCTPVSGCQGVRAPLLRNIESDGLATAAASLVHTTRWAGVAPLQAQTVPSRRHRVLYGTSHVGESCVCVPGVQAVQRRRTRHEPLPALLARHKGLQSPWCEQHHGVNATSHRYAVCTHPA